MKTVISRRAIARIVSFSLAIIAVLAAMDVIYMNKLANAEDMIEYSYRQAVEDLASSADQISATLTKGMYAASPAMMSKLSTQLMSQANTAKVALTKLPVANINLEKTERFLSQVGNYAYSLSEAAAAGQEPSYEDYSSMNTLCQNAKALSDMLWDMQGRLFSNDKSISVLFSELTDSGSSFITDGFNEMENNFATTPKLIYDGPFSDHIIDKTPKMTAGAKEVSEEKALENAAKYLGMEDWQLKTSETGEAGKMPSYLFYADGVNCAVTKQGGYISYIIKSREVRNQKITPEQASVYAKAYIDSLGIENMEQTYYETYNNVCTINYAYNENGVTYYTDLIKVSVALDDGEILGFDARGFIVNHHERDFGEPVLGQEQCQEKLSRSLSVVKASLAVIPTDSVEEKLCWEFKCKTSDDSTVLVYVNTSTGVEEDILILIEMDESSLTV